MRLVTRRGKAGVFHLPSNNDEPYCNAHKKASADAEFILIRTKDQVYETDICDTCLGVLDSFNGGIIRD